MNSKHRIVFLGTPDFAAASLQALIEHSFNVVAVVTAPDKPQGRGKKVGMSAVKMLAVRHDLPVLQPTNLKSDAFIQELRNYQADLQIVVAFRMLPEVVWDMPPLGTFNLHASLLPQYRGAAPINWAIINGEKETGVTTFFLKHEIDTGAIIYQETEPIHPNDTVGDLYDRLMEKGARLVVKTAAAIQSGEYPQEPQLISGALKSAPKIFKDNCQINWDRSSQEVLNFIRGLSPYPGAWTHFEEKTLKIFKAQIINDVSASKTGILKIEHDRLLVKTSDGTIAIEELQMEGKKRMKTADFLRGYKT